MADGAVFAFVQGDRLVVVDAELEVDNVAEVVGIDGADELAKAWLALEEGMVEVGEARGGALDAKLALSFAPVSEGDCLSRELARCHNHCAG